MLPVFLVPLATLPLALVSMYEGELERSRGGGGDGRRVAPPGSAPPGLAPASPGLEIELPELGSESVDAVTQGVMELEAAGLPVPDTAASRLSEAEVSDYLDAASGQHLGDRATVVLLSIGVPPEMIFLGKFMVRYRWLFSPTVFDLLPEDWQRAIDEAIDQDWDSDLEIAESILIGVGLDPDTAKWILSGLDRLPTRAPEGFGLDPSGRRISIPWNRDAARTRLLEEAEEGHLFASRSPPGA